MSTFPLRSAVTPHRAWIIAIALLLLCAASWRAIDQMNQVPAHETGFFSHELAPVTLPDIRLHDDREVAHTLADFRGKVVVMVIGAADCETHDCTVALNRAATLRRDLGAAADHIAVVFASLASRSPVALDRYVRNFDDSFIGLHASDDNATRQMIERFQADRQTTSHAATQADSYSNSAAIYVFDTAGHLRLEVPDSETTDAMGSDVRRLIEEH